jgi:DNA-binding transcriptional MerR regulator
MSSDAESGLPNNFTESGLQQSGFVKSSSDGIAVAVSAPDMPLPPAPLPLNQFISRTDTKAPMAFRTISEVATELDVPQHVLRFWESRFNQIQPMKRGGGRRYYRPEDVLLLKRIKDLLYGQGFTIKGVQKVLKDGSAKVASPRREPQPEMPAMKQATEVLKETMAAVQAVPTIAVNTATATGLSMRQRQQLEGTLAELKSLREILRQAGV